MRMTAGLVAALSIAVGSAALLSAQGGPSKKTDQERFAGTWRLNKGKANGQELPAEFTTLLRLTFSKDGKAVMSLVEESKEGLYKLPAGGQIDLTLAGNKELSPGIYRFDGDDRLTVCVKEGVRDKRPTEFSGEQGTGQVLLVLERAKPGEEKPTPQEIAKYKDAADKVRDAAARAQSQNNLKQIGLAMHSYHDAYKQFPLHAAYSQDVKTPPLSWRVAILPFVEENALYQQFKLDEPWDSRHNRQLIAKMPKVYEPVGAAKKGEGLTFYQVFTGPDTVFDGPKQ
jgi:uncharacterized protein (TIGR03067 family)